MKKIDNMNDLERIDYFRKKYKIDAVFSTVYEHICKAVKRYAKNENSNMYIELVDECFKIWLQHRGKCSLPYIIELCTNRVESAYKNKKRNNAEYNIGIDNSKNEHYIYNDINWYCRKDLVKTNKTCRKCNRDIKTNKIIDCKICGFKRFWDNSRVREIRRN